MKTFRGWLRVQVKRDDPVGDLARDFAEDSRIGCLRRGLNSAEALRDHMMTVHPSSENALHAFDQAYLEYDLERFLEKQTARPRGQQTFLGWPPCERCGKRVSSKDARLAVDPNAAQAVVSASERDSGAIDAAKYVDRRAEWRWFHRGCESDEDGLWYGFDATRLGTVAGALAMTLHLMKKSWLKGSKWEDVIRHLWQL